MTLDKRQYPARTRTTRLCAATAAALAFGLCVFFSPSHGQTAAEDQSVRPFKVQVPQAALDDLHRRTAATRWPDKETVADQSQGAVAVLMVASGSALYVARAQQAGTNRTDLEPHDLSAPSACPKRSTASD